MTMTEPINFGRANRMSEITQAVASLLIRGASPVADLYRVHTIRYVTIIFFCFCGCARGPTHDYYNPAMVGAKFKGPITMALVDDVKSETENCVRDGFTVIGKSDY